MHQPALEYRVLDTRFGEQYKLEKDACWLSVPLIHVRRPCDLIGYDDDKEKNNKTVSSS